MFDGKHAAMSADDMRSRFLAASLFFGGGKLHSSFFGGALVIPVAKSCQLGLSYNAVAASWSTRIGWPHLP